MKQYRMLFIFIAILVVASLACNGGAAPTPTQAPTNTPRPTSAPVQPPSNNNNSNSGANPPQPPSGNPPPSNGNSSDIVTFTDQNNLLAFDLPGDWTYDQYTETDLYIDKFTSPDGQAAIDSLVWDNNGDAVDKGAAALYLLNNYYSKTGATGDIKVTSDSIEQDGSERLEWMSKSGGYSGISWFETRNGNTTFLMFTTWWVDGVSDATFNTVNNAITTYHVP